jgi:hypothetical protein
MRAQLYVGAMTFPILYRVPDDFCHVYYGQSPAISPDYKLKYSLLTKEISRERFLANISFTQYSLLNIWI